jgi:hypothetical protein
MKTNDTVTTTLLRDTARRDTNSFDAVPSDLCRNHYCWQAADRIDELKGGNKAA